MTTTEAIYRRRAVRDYTDEVISEQTIKELIDAAAQAPSSVNVQPWAFVVVQDKDLLKKISARATELMDTEGLSEARREAIEDPNWNIFYNAGTLIVVNVRYSAHNTPASAPGSAVMMMNGSSQLWKFTTSSR